MDFSILTTAYLHIGLCWFNSEALHLLYKHKGNDDDDTVSFFCRWAIYINGIEPGFIAVHWFWFWAAHMKCLCSLWLTFREKIIKNESVVIFQLILRRISQHTVFINKKLNQRKCFLLLRFLSLPASKQAHVALSCFWVFFPLESDWYHLYFRLTEAKMSRSFFSSLLKKSNTVTISRPAASRTGLLNIL